MEQREQSVQVVCPKCGTKLLVKNVTGVSERMVNCPKCQQLITVNFTLATPSDPAVVPPPAPVPSMMSQPPASCGESNVPTSSVQHQETSSTTPLQSQVVHPNKRKSSNRGLLIGVLSGLVVILAGVLVWFLVFKNKPAPQVDDAEEKESVSAEAASAVSVLSEADVEDVPVKLHVLNVEYNRSLAPQAGNTYYAKNLLDGNSGTCWAVRLDDDDVYDYLADALLGPTFTVECKKLAYIVIRNGYCKSERAYRNNTRAAKISFINQEYWGDDVTNWDWDGEALLYQGRLQDTMEPQRLDIPENKSCNNDVRRIQMIFDGDYNSYYHGAKWNDLCISEVEFWGYE